MGLIRKYAERALWSIIESRSSLNNPQTPLSFPAEWLLDIFNGGRTDSGIRVSEMVALQTDAVLACVKIICNGVATLPLHVFERQMRDDRPAKRVAFDHPLYDLLRQQPNPEMTSHTYRSVMMVHDLLWGNAYAELQRDNGNRVVALWPRNPARTRPVRLTHDAKIEGTVYPVGTLVYHTSETIGDEISGQDDSGNRMAPERIILAEDMIHVPGLSLDGRLGQSTVYLARQIIGLALASERFGAKFFGNGAVPRGILELPGVMEPKAIENLRRSWQEAHGGENQHKTAVLEQGVKYTPIGLDPEKSQFLSTRKYQRTAVASIFNVPPHMIGEGESSKSTVEQTSIEFLTYCLNPWLDAYEQEFKRKLFPLDRPSTAKFFAKFDTHKLLYPNAESRSKYYTGGKQGGWLNTNDIHEMEDMNPVEDGSGDVYWMPVNMQDAANPLTAPHIGGKQNLDYGVKAENPMGGAPQNPDKPGAQAAPGTSKVKASLVMRYSKVYLPMFRDATGRVLNRREIDVAGFNRCFTPSLHAMVEALSSELAPTEADAIPAEEFNDVVKTYLDGMRSNIQGVTPELSETYAVKEVRRAAETLADIVAKRYSPHDAVRHPNEQTRANCQECNAMVDCDVVKVLPGAVELRCQPKGHIFICPLDLFKRYNPDHAKQPRHPDGKWHDGKKPFFIGRHGTTDDDVKKLWSGWRDITINEQGRQEIADSIEKIKDLGIKRIVSSNLPRAIDTARLYANGLGNIPMTTDWRLNALDLGIFAGMDEEKNGDRLKIYIDNPDIPIPGGEAVNGYVKRSQDAINEHREKNESTGPILAIMHSSSVAAYLDNLKGVNAGDHSSLENSSAMLSPAGVIQLDGKKVTVLAGKLTDGDAA